MLTVYHSPTHLFYPVHFSFSALHELEWLSHLQQSPVPMQFPPPNVVIATDAMSTHWAFYFQGYGLPFWILDPGPVLHVVLILPCRSFSLSPWCFIEWLSTFLVRWLPCILDNSTAKTYLCNQGGTVSPFLSRLAYWILSLTDNTILLLSSIHSYCLNVVAHYLSWGSCFQSGIFSLRWLKQLFAFGIYQRWICWHPPVPLLASIIMPCKL